MIKKNIYGKTLKDQLKASARDKLYNFILADGTIRGVILNSVRMINEMRANHDLGILETLILGHSYLGAGLMSANLKGNDRLQLKIDCSGPVKGLVVETNAYNEVRGYLKNPSIPIDKPLDTFNISPFLGAGFLMITKYLEDSKQPFTGQVALEYGNIAKDLAHYHLISEQIPTAFNLSIQFDTQGTVTGAGGLLLQVMPGADDQTIRDLENLVKNLPSIGAIFSNNKDPQLFILEIFRKYSPKFLANRRVEFLCHCRKEKMQHLMALLPEKEITDILANGPFPVEIVCHHCNTYYYFSKQEIQTLFCKKQI